MKVIRSFLITILSTILVIFLTSLTVSSVIDDVFQKELVSTFIKQSLVEEDAYTPEIGEAIDNLTSAPELNDVISTVLNEYTSISKGEKSEVDPETVDMLLDFINKYQDDLEKAVGTEFDVSEFTTPEAKEELTKYLNENLGKLDLSDNEVIANSIETFTAVTYENKTTGIYLSIIIIIALIALISWSYYAWMKPVGAALISTSIFAFIIYGGLTTMLNYLASNTAFQINLNSHKLLIIGIIELVVGIAMRIIVKKLNKKYNTKLEETTPEPTTEEQVEEINEL